MRTNFFLPLLALLTASCCHHQSEPETQPTATGTAEINPAPMILPTPFPQLPPVPMKPDVGSIQSETPEIAPSLFMSYKNTLDQHLPNDKRKYYKAEFLRNKSGEKPPIAYALFSRSFSVAVKEKPDDIKGEIMLYDSENRKIGQVKKIVRNRTDDDRIQLVYIFGDTLLAKGTGKKLMIVRDQSSTAIVDETYSVKPV